VQQCANISRPSARVRDATNAQEEFRSSTAAVDTPLGMALKHATV